MNGRSSLCAGLAALTLAFATACTNTAASTSDDPSPAGSSVPSAAAPSTPVPSSTAKPVSIDKPYRYPDGVAVSVVGVEHGELGEFEITEDPNAKAGDPYTVLSIKVHNGSKKEIAPLIVATLYYGAEQKQAARIDIDSYADGPEIAPGKSFPLDLAYLIPVEERDQVRLEVALNTVEPEPAQFVGSVARARD